MWAATVSFPCLSNIRVPIILNNRADGGRKRQSLNLRASFFDYPLASRVMVRSDKRYNYKLEFPAGGSYNSFQMLAQCIWPTELIDLPYSADESRLQEEFSNFGEIAEVILAKDRVTKRSKGYAFIQYTSQDDALLALENMDNKKFDGRMIYVEVAKPGSDSFGGYPRTSGPPQERPKLELLEEVADCWY